MSTDDRTNVNDDASSNDEVQISDLNDSPAVPADDEVRGGINITKKIDKASPVLYQG